MKLPSKELPDGGGAYLRPVLAVRIAGQEHVLHACLLDTGALHNRFARWAAEAAGLDLRSGARDRLAVGGIVTEAVTLPVELEAEGLRRHAAVSFCEPWPFGFQLLGQEGFFRFFRVGFRAATYTFDVDPDSGETD